MNAGCRGWSSTGAPGLPSGGGGNRDRCGERSGNTVQMEFQRASTVSGAGQARIHAAYSCPEIHILIDGIVAITGEGYGIAAIQVGGIFGLQAECGVVSGEILSAGRAETGGLDLKRSTDLVSATLRAGPGEGRARQRRQGVRERLTPPPHLERLDERGIVVHHQRLRSIGIQECRAHQAIRVARVNPHRARQDVLAEWPIV